MLQLLVDPLVLQYVTQTLVYLLVEDLILLEEFQVVTLESVPFQHQSIVLSLCLPHDAFGVLETLGQLPVLFQH